MRHGQGRQSAVGFIGLGVVLACAEGCVRFGFDLIDESSNTARPGGNTGGAAGSGAVGPNQFGIAGVTASFAGGTQRDAIGGRNGAGGASSEGGIGTGASASGTRAAIGGTSPTSGGNPNLGGASASTLGGFSLGGAFSGSFGGLPGKGGTSSLALAGATTRGGMINASGGINGVGGSAPATSSSATGGITTGGAIASGGVSGSNGSGGAGTSGSGSCNPVVDLFPTVPVTDANNLFGSADDATLHVAFSLGFQFSFYGVQYPGIHLNTNGGLTFGAGDDWWTADVTFHDQPSIAVFWTDMDCLSYGADLRGHQIAYQQCSDRFIVTYNQLQDKFTSGWVGSATVTLHADGSIEIQYGTVTDQEILVGIFDGSHSPAEKELKKLETSFTNYASYGSGIILFDPKFDNTGTRHQGELTGQTIVYSPI